MKYTLIALAVLILLAPLALVGDQAMPRENEHGHAHDHGGGHHPTIFIPESLPDLWAALNAYGKVVADAAASGAVETLHKQRVNLGALVGALAASAGDLEPGKKERVEGMIGNAQRALDQLHAAADADDPEAIRRAAKGLAGILMLLKAQYPKEVTAGTAEVKDDIGPHEGVLAGFSGPGGELAGHLELKLHDDKGDLELWLAKDAAITEAFDIPADKKITIAFEGAKEGRVTLAVRNMDENEDEEGTPNLREGRTNYFIFPGESGADSTWLTGGDFEATVTVSFATEDGVFSSKPFLLVPHGGHGGGHAH